MLLGQAPVLVVADHGDHMVVRQVASVVTRLIDTNVVVLLLCQVLLMVLVTVTIAKTAFPSIIA